MHILKHRSQSGDTIVEVLLAIGIIAMVLGGAYAATNKSLQYSRAAQERSEALKVAEMQVEQLKKIKDSGESDSTFAPISPFCIKADGTIKENITSIQNQSECLSGDRYYPSIEKDANGVYKVRVLWENVTGGRSVSVGSTAYPGYDQAQLYYRAYSFDGATSPYSLVTPAPTITLTAAPASVVIGNKSKLSWSSNYALTCTGSGGWAVNTTSGSNYDTAALVTNTTYTLTCTGLNGTATKSVTVTVIPPAPTVTFTAAPSSVGYNAGSTLSWSSSNATSCSASGAWNGAVGLSGSAGTGGLTSNQTYMLTCSGLGGSTAKSASVTVGAAPPSVSLSASPTTVVNGQGTTLNWSSSNATSCNASGNWSGAKAVNSGEYVIVSPGSGNASFTLTCNGPGGSASSTTAVGVLYEQKTGTSVPRPDQYSRVCHATNYLGWAIYYYALPYAGNGCIAGGTYDYEASPGADSLTYNRACSSGSFYVYIPNAYSGTVYCPQGWAMLAGGR